LAHPIRFDHSFPEHFAEGTFEHPAKCNRLVNFGLDGIYFSFVNSLTADIHYFSQCFLRHVFAKLPQVLQIFAKAHVITSDF